MATKDTIVYTVQTSSQKWTITARDAMIAESGILTFHSFDYGLIAAFAPNEWLSFTAKVPDEPTDAVFTVVGRGGCGSADIR